MVPKRARWVVLIILLLIATGAAHAGESRPPRAGTLIFGAGTFNFGHTHPSGGIGLEYRLDSRPWSLGAKGGFSLVPAFGLVGTSKDAVFVYAGVRTDLDFTPRWRVTPGFSIGAYDRSGDIDLGGPVEFRSSLDVSRAVGKGMRIGMTIYHISNARLYDRNPGVNALAFVQAF